MKRSKRKPETAASLRGILSQLRRRMNLRSLTDGNVTLTYAQSRRIYSALQEFERFESILTEPGDSRS